jgi:MFS-type transporter involved in bile tolerance (Atg22 family)
VTGSSRQAILSLIAFFALGFILLAFVNIDQARQAKQHWHFQGAAASVD